MAPTSAVPNESLGNYQLNTTGLAIGTSRFHNHLLALTFANFCFSMARGSKMIKIFISSFGYDNLLTKLVLYTINIQYVESPISLGQSLVSSPVPFPRRPDIVLFFE